MPSSWYSVLLCLLGTAWVSAQTNQAMQIMTKEFAQYGLISDDVQSVRISSQHYSTQTGYHYVYLQQQWQDIDISNAIWNMVFDEGGNLLQSKSRFEPINAQGRSTSSHQLSPRDALAGVARELNTSLGPISEQRARAASAKKFFLVPALSKDLITVQKVWEFEGQNLLAVMTVKIIDRLTNKPWTYRFDGTTGRLLSKKSRLLSCHIKHPNDVPKAAPSLRSKNLTTSASLMGASYRVLPLGTESPAHGQRVLITEPADPDASPFGWHDLNGVMGAEFLDTRGNNVFAQEDFDANDRGGLRPNGGNNLLFDYPLATDLAEDHIEASITNLFYWVNVNHDIFHHYGFDEAAGNFQVTNYTGIGEHEDPVIADAQDGADRNNATFFTQEDGFPARIQMHLWGAEALDVQIGLEGSSELPGTIAAIESAFSSQNKLVNIGVIDGKLVLARDQLAGSSLACSASPIQNGDEIKGRVALIDRGTCFFVEKVRNAESLGAVAVIVCNNVAGDPIPMGGNDNGITIPAVMISQSDCAVIKQALENGADVKVSIDRRPSADDFDSSLDNLIITHEFTHGLTLRLTGGSGTVDCLSNQEQMSEGWSDYFGLMLTTDWITARPRDIRGVSSYLLGQGNSGRGIRNFPYTTNRRTNPVRYSDIRTFSIPHGVGSVWAAMLWDMTWAIIEAEGVSDDLYRGKAGNNIALRLVVEALKLQPCNPGFVDARDAILLADQLLYDGKHQLAIWKAFAGRGLGVAASQGHANNVLDGQSDFSLPEEFRTQIDAFVAKDSLDNILLSWTSLREIDHGSFKIVKSRDKLQWSDLTEFTGGALKDYSTPYLFLDQDVQTGTWYFYRLDQIGQTGAVREMGMDSAFVVPVEKALIFPNPATSSFSVKLSRSIIGPVHLSLFANDGKRIWSQSGEAADYYQNRLIEQLDIIPGTYLLEIRTDDQHLTERIVFY